MKNLLATLAIATVFVGVASTANAQAAGPKTQGNTSVAQEHERNRADIHRDIMAQLNLSQDQKKKIRALHKENKAKNAALKEELEKSNASDEVRKQKQLALRKDQQAALRALLTADQQKKFDDLMKEEIKKLRQARKAKPGKE
jgi:Spy/CpxP family protein refolding chaperone